MSEHFNPGHHSHEPQPRELGVANGQVFVSDDFDDPLPEELLVAFEG